ncbi:MAG: BON domain-containing protein [Gemmatimonadaceae bacterium]|nr:BON domain-containing protein [Gemmatimonadaceae bacterium]
MSPIQYREEEESGSHSSAFLVVGAIAGLAAGVIIAEKFGGFRGLTDRIKEKFGAVGDVFLGEGELDDDFEDDDEEDGEEYEDGVDDYAASYVAPIKGSEELEERVLEAYRNDPILSERAVDIGAIQEGIIELTGWVNAEDEAKQAVDVARGVPGVETVVNRLAVRSDEDLFDEMADRYEAGDASLTEAHWEGQQVGTGRRRQGNSTEVDRHAGPRDVLEDRSLSEDSAYLAAADEIDVSGESRRRNAKKQATNSRTDGSPVAPTGVPKADHVTDVGPAL